MARWTKRSRIYSRRRPGAAPVDAGGGLTGSSGLPLSGVLRPSRGFVQTDALALNSAGSTDVSMCTGMVVVVRDVAF
jgi:hypothetical protein